MFAIPEYVPLVPTLSRVLLVDWKHLLLYLRVFCFQSAGTTGDRVNLRVTW